MPKVFTPNAVKAKSSNLDIKTFNLGNRRKNLYEESIPIQFTFSKFI